MRPHAALTALAALVVATTALAAAPAHAEKIEGKVGGCLKWSYSPGSGGETVYYNSHCPKELALAVHGKDPVVGKVSCKITVAKGKKGHRRLAIDVHGIDGKASGLQECRAV